MSRKQFSRSLNLPSEFCLLLTLVWMIAGCAGSIGETGTDVHDTPRFETLEDLQDRRVAVTTGSTYEQSLQKDFPEMQVMRIDTEADIIQALMSRKCDAGIFDSQIIRYHSQSINGIRTLDEPYSVSEIGAVFNKNNTRLRDEFNEFLKSIKDDGTYDDIYDRWINKGQSSEIPEIELPLDGEPIKASTILASPPMAFIKDGKMAGMDIELMIRFAQYVNRPIEFYDMNFSSIIPSIVSGSSDLSLCCLTISEERAKSVNFSDPYFFCESLITVYDPASVAMPEGNFLQSLKSSFTRNLIEEDRYKLILNGFKTTAWISLLATLLGTILGGIICWMKMCRHQILKTIASAYISIMRGTPVLVLLMIMFYVVFTGSGISAVFISVLTFAMNFSAYVSEIFRSSIESIDRGQTEAGVSLGFNKFQTFVYIVLPQAFRQAIPVFKGEIISLVKMTSVVGYIAVQDLTKVGDIIRSRTFDAFFPLIVVAVLYFILAWIFSSVLDLIAGKTIKE